MLQPISKPLIHASRSIVTVFRSTHSTQRNNKFSTSTLYQTKASTGHNPAIAADLNKRSTANAAFGSEESKHSSGPQSSPDQGDVNKDASPSRNTLPEPEGGKPADRAAPMSSNPGNSNDGKEFSEEQDEVDSSARPERNK